MPTPRVTVAGDMVMLCQVDASHRYPASLLLGGVTGFVTVSFFRCFLG